MSLNDIFGDDFAKGAFLVTDSEPRIVGKFCEVTLNNDGSFDLWIVKPDRAPIGTCKLKNLFMAIRNTGWNGNIHVLTGEAWLTTNEPCLVRGMASLLGIPRRRRYSPTTLERLRGQARRNFSVSAEGGGGS